MQKTDRQLISIMAEASVNDGPIQRADLLSIKDRVKALPHVIADHFSNMPVTRIHDMWDYAIRQGAAEGIDIEKPAVIDVSKLTAEHLNTDMGSFTAREEERRTDGRSSGRAGGG